MFVPVTCTNCGKPFQVPETALGKLAPCPWCEAVVTAVSVEEPQQAPEPAEREPQTPSAASLQQPLSLDNEEPPAPAQKSPTATLQKPHPTNPAQSAPVPAIPVTEPPPRSSPLRLVLMILIGLIVTVAVTTLTLGLRQRKEGRGVQAEWRKFVAPDGSCSVDLLGTPIEDPDAPANGARRYTSEGWYSGVRTWIGWKDLTAAEASSATGPEAWRSLRPKLFDPEWDRLKAAFGGYEVEGGGTKSFTPLTVEFRLQTPTGLLVERAFLKADGPRPRVYFVGMLGKRLTPDAPELTRLFDSFRVND